MSAYRHSASAVQRAKKRSATGAAAYRTGTKLIDVRTGAEYDYTHRRGVAAAHLIVPSAPHIDAVDRQALWAAVERKHTRGDAVPAREFVTNLPCELDPIDRLSLALRYGQHVSDTYGVAVDIGVHLPSIKPGHDQRNHHVHFLFSACSVSYADGVLQCGKKVEALDPIASKRRGGVPVEEAERATWARMCNEALAAAGRADVTVDHRSYERQGIELLPQIHLGPDAHDNLLRHQNDPGNVVLLDRTREWLEIEKSNSYLREAQRFDAEVARLEAEVIDMPPPAPRPDKPVSGPSAAVVHLRPAAPEPAPDTAAVLDQVARLWAAYARADGVHDDARDSWPMLRSMDRNGWRHDAPGLLAVLEAHPALRREWSAEITSREPEIAAAERAREQERRQIRKQAARALLTPVPSPSPARAPAEKAAPGPVARRDIATVPAPLPAVVRTVRDVDAAIDEAEARLQTLEQRERVRAAAAEAYRRAQAGLQAAQAGLWSRLRAWVGAGASAAELGARAELKAAEQALKSQGGTIVFGKVVMPADTAAERLDLKKQLVALRDERGGLVASEAATAARAAAAVGHVVDQVARADRVVTAERATWPALVALDAAGGIEQLRERLTRDPGLLTALAYDLGRRLPALEALELAPVLLVEQLPPRPEGLRDAVEAGPRFALRDDWGAWLAGCEQRDWITPTELVEALELLRDVPAGPLQRDELLQLIDEQLQQRDAGHVPGA